MDASAAFTIRVATHDDIPAIKALIELSVRGLQREDYPPSQIDSSIGSAFGIDHQLLDDRTYFIATTIDDPSTLIASGGWSFRRTLCGSDQLRERDSSALDPAVDYAKIRGIYVHPQWARRGLGSLLLQYSEQAAQDAGFRRFEMGSTLTGVPLYALRGYVEQERMGLPLPNGESLEVVRMIKSL